MCFYLIFFSFQGEKLEFYLFDRVLADVPCRYVLVQCIFIMLTNSVSVFFAGYICNTAASKVRLHK